MCEEEEFFNKIIKFNNILMSNFTWTCGKKQWKECGRDKRTQQKRTAGDGRWREDERRAQDGDEEERGEREDEIRVGRG